MVFGVCTARNLNMQSCVKLVHRLMRSGWNISTKRECKQGNVKIRSDINLCRCSSKMGWEALEREQHDYICSIGFHLLFTVVDSDSDSYMGSNCLNVRSFCRALHALQPDAVKNDTDWTGVVVVQHSGPLACTLMSLFTGKAFKSASTSSREPAIHMKREHVVAWLSLRSSCLKMETIPPHLSQICFHDTETAPWII